MFFVNMFRRIIFLIATVVIWPIWFITTIIYTPLFYFILLIVIPILWLIIGSGELLDKIGFILFYRENDELWYKEYDSDYKNGKFFSVVPRWARYLQENYLNNILPKNDRD